MPRRPVGVAGDNAARALARMLGVRLQYDDELARAVSTALSPRTFVGRVLQRWQGRRIELVACAIATVSVLVGSTYLLLRKSPVHEPLPHPKAVAAAELLIFACSPNVAPLPQAGSEATEVAMATSWGDAVIISFGGDAERLRSSLVGSRPRHFLFTGHSDLKLGDSLTLGFTKPGGWLEAVDIELIAEMLGAHSVTNGGSLELAFINGCHSHQLGEAVRRAGVPAVVCWQGRVCDGAARLFACAFFQAVAGQMGYKRAFAEARRAVLLATRRSRDKGVALPIYELRDPDVVVEATPALDRAAAGGGYRGTAPSTRRRIAAGVPMLLCDEPDRLHFDHGAIEPTPPPAQQLTPSPTQPASPEGAGQDTKLLMPPLPSTPTPTV